MITVDTDALRDTVRWVVDGLPAKPTQVGEDAAHIYTGEDFLAVEAADGLQTKRVRIPLRKIDGPFDVAVASGRLIKALGAMRSKTVKLTATSTSLEVAAGRSHLKLSRYADARTSAFEAPSVAMGFVDGPRLEECLKHAASCASKQVENRLSAVRLELSTGQLLVEAADGYRLYRTAIEADYTGDTTSALVAGSRVRALSLTRSMGVSITSRSVRFSGGNIAAEIAQYNAEYPNFAAVFDLSDPMGDIRFDLEEMTSAIGLVKVTAEVLASGGFLMWLEVTDDGTVKLYSADETSSSSAEVEAQTDDTLRGQRWQFNTAVLGGMLDLCEGVVTIGIDEGLRHGIKSDRVTGLVMGVKPGRGET